MRKVSLILMNAWIPEVACLYAHTSNTTYMCIFCSHNSNPSTWRLVNTNQYMDLKQVAKGHSCHNTSSKGFGQKASCQVYRTGGWVVFTVILHRVSHPCTSFSICSAIIDCFIVSVGTCKLDHQNYLVLSLSAALAPITWSLIYWDYIIHFFYFDLSFYFFSEMSSADGEG